MSSAFYEKLLLCTVLGGKKSREKVPDLAHNNCTFLPVF